LGVHCKTGEGAKERERETNNGGKGKEEMGGVPRGMGPVALAGKENKEKKREKMYPRGFGEPRRRHVLGKVRTCSAPCWRRWKCKKKKPEKFKKG